MCRPISSKTRTHSKMKNTLMLLGKRMGVIAVKNKPHCSYSTSFCQYFSSDSNHSSPPTNKLFVAGLSWSVDEKTLKDAFSSFGEITEVRIMYDKDTGRSRGFGFVYFSKGDDAASAKDAMDGKAYLGRPLRISYALEKVRGGPVVVPRFANSGIANARKN